jgi:hypothetical protein
MTVKECRQSHDKKLDFSSMQIAGFDDLLSERTKPRTGMKDTYSEDVYEEVHERFYGKKVVPPKSTTERCADLNQSIQRRLGNLEVMLVATKKHTRWFKLSSDIDELYEEGDAPPPEGGDDHADAAASSLCGHSTTGPLGGSLPPAESLALASSAGGRRRSSGGGGGGGAGAHKQQQQQQQQQQQRRRQHTNELLLSGNLLPSLDRMPFVCSLVVDPASLLFLDLSSNQLASLDHAFGLLANLKKLYLHRNRLPGPLGPGCCVRELMCMKKLQVLQMNENPVEREPDYLHYVRAALPLLAMHDKCAITPVDRRLADAWGQLHFVHHDSPKQIKAKEQARRRARREAQQAKSRHEELCATIERENQARQAAAEAERERLREVVRQEARERLLMDAEGERVAAHLAWAAERARVEAARAEEERVAEAAARALREVEEAEAARLAKMTPAQRKALARRQERMAAQEAKKLAAVEAEAGAGEPAPVAGA